MGAELAAGSVIGDRYRLEHKLGQGGMGAVWAATHTVTGRVVALKLVRGPAHLRAERRRRLLREARAASAVAHPNVVEILDAFEHDEETPVMVMELLEGETLRERIARQEMLPLSETATLMLPVISAVRAAHARGVVHRDLKPDNIVLVDADDGCVPRVLDFGIAKLTEPLDPAAATQSGSTAGTPCYMAPEQALGERDIDAAADVWALGVILYECLSGVRPIEGESVGQVVMHLMSTGITPLEHLELELPSEVTELVSRMLSRERRKRLSDLAEVSEVLERYAAGRVPDPQLSSHPAGPSSPVGSWRRRAAMVSVGVGGAFLAAALLYDGPTHTSATSPLPPASTEAPAPSPSVSTLAQPTGRPVDVQPTPTKVPRAETTASAKASAGRATPSAQARGTTSSGVAPAASSAGAAPREGLAVEPPAAPSAKPAPVGLAETPPF